MKTKKHENFALISCTLDGCLVELLQSIAQIVFVFCFCSLICYQYDWTSTFQLKIVACFGRLISFLFNFYCCCFRRNTWANSHDDLDISLTLVCFTGTSVWMWRTFSGKKREKIDWFHIKWCNELTQFKIKCLDSRLRTRIFLSKIKTKTSTPKWNTHSVCLVFSIIQKVNIAYGLRSHNFNTHKKFHVQCQDLRKHGVSDARFVWFDFVWFCLFTSMFFWR